MDIVSLKFTDKLQRAWSSFFDGLLKKQEKRNHAAHAGGYQSISVAIFEIRIHKFGVVFV